MSGGKNDLSWPPGQDVDYPPQPDRGILMTDPSAIPSQTPPAAPAAFTGASIDRLRKLRCLPERNLTITATVDQYRREASKSRRGMGNFVDAWEAVVPAEIAATSRVRGVRGGIARIGVVDSATSYEIDQQLRGGMLAELRLAFGGTLRRVKLEIDGSLSR
eukprot:GHVR01098492.1.p1 GENE.GHVR01098492.1~~GHVR01098492.1.p1  ORF type:complete len:161 (-),score=10.03 GHVR01098492.1:295-777(-)